MKRILLLLIVFGFVFVGCRDGLNRPEQYAAYINSFETPKDTVHSEGVKYNMFVNDPAPQCGYKSLQISGGCYQPAAVYYFEGPDRATKYRLEFWGKMIETGQSAIVVISPEKNDPFGENEITITVNGTDWNYYRASKVIDLPAKAKFKVSVICGGIIPATLKMDYLTLVDVE